MKMAGSSTMVHFYQTTLHHHPIFLLLPLPQYEGNGSTIWCAEAMTTFSLFVTWNGIVPVLPVNKIYIVYFEFTTVCANTTQ